MGRIYFCLLGTLALAPQKVACPLFPSQARADPATAAVASPLGWGKGFTSPSYLTGSHISQKYPHKPNYTKKSEQQNSPICKGVCLRDSQPQFRILAAEILMQRRMITLAVFVGNVVTYSDVFGDSLESNVDREISCHQKKRCQKR